MRKHKKAFTLAEILITLLIVGVVASLVIPAIIQNSQDTEFNVAYKKAYAMAELATKQAVFDGSFVPRGGTSDPTATIHNFNVFKSYFSVAKECMSSNNNKCWNSTGERACTGNCSPDVPLGVPTQGEKAFIDNSGMAWSLYANAEDIIVVDTNGNKNPNRFGKDRWMFVFKDQYNHRITVGLPYKMGIYYNSDQTTPDLMACHYPPCYFIKWLK